MANDNLPNLKQYQDHYSDHGLWGKVSKVAQKAGVKVIYLALLFYYVLKDPMVTRKDKSLIYGALGYFILPVDLIPDAIPVVGFSDDLAALVAVYVAMKRSITPAIEAQAKEKLSKWFPNYTEEDIDIQE
ncbi:MAG: YkvA family protein [Bacteroidia bacterium]|nr:YkvA family protein [Bacteroidia bacterium]